MSYFFVQTRSIYYYFLPWLDVPGYANLTFTTKTQVPTRWNGLVLVIVLAVVNLAIVWAIVVMYVIYGDAQ